MKKRKNNIKVVKDELNPETPEVLAASIIQIGEAMQKLCGVGGLTLNGVTALICGMEGNSHLKKQEVMTVLEGLNRLKSYYIRK